ncbi:hypothetical protein [Paenibacillus naphthalenovorans]|uniref:hypothetical protein n=1 Tax=Paenibacillus naphthalenovorans TaxID=162209 RepID=UPI003D2A4919
MNVIKRIYRGLLMVGAVCGITLSIIVVISLIFGDAPLLFRIVFAAVIAAGVWVLGKEEGAGE